MEVSRLSTALIFLVPQVLAMVIEKYKLSEETAVELFYTSELYTVLEEEETKLWHLSALTLFELFQEERETGVINYPEEA
ncbi:MAG: hypothetical protein LBS74_05300 [Oscillospiraceae bacterium]|jgi:hypothetical protein|nr:hypothetical protein [Oscillospiraceae bacterium]